MSETHRDRLQDEAVRQTFPASDPPSGNAGQGSRAVPAESMMPDGAAPTNPDAVTLSLRFPESESAKLALEAAVREGPLDRRCASIDLDDDRVTMRLDVPRADAKRMEALMRRHGAMEA
ncbi:hypothetical protein JYK14_16680 [Siccirubricoccus sp. KC 17139]|uniref:Uncharacterized protein n=1 Tax=Siccirubricoccus soli TaxID=2899147 RepID=A0ABT1D773_9PROT|nr:hypothetical protein [Siccirubricoccus soli]MCO6417785.1 hypothetical protein [Siccirubricoccus soli]MCP2683920.1 hypothetical protein [Siccirubricoccus soli]